MEKRRLISLRSVLLQYLVRTALACLLVAVGWLLVLLLWIQNSGLFLPANQAAQACQKAAQDVLPGMTAATFDETQLDSLCRYALFAAPDSSEVLATNMDAGHLQRAMENRQGKTRWHFGYTQYYMTSKLQDGTVCLLQFDYAVPYAAPALRGKLPDVQTVHCILGILLLVGAVVWSTHRTGRFLTRETEKLTAAAQAVARKELDSAVFSGAKVREYESALQALQTMGDELTGSLQKQWDMEQRQREQIIRLSHKLKTPLTIIRGNAELLAEDDLTEEQRAQVEAILQGAEQTRTYLGKIRAELDVKPDLWFFACHFQGDPVMPGCLGLDAMWQLIGFYLTWLQLPGRGRALGAGAVKFTGEVGPDVKLVTYEIDIKRVIKRKLVMAIGDARLLADGKEIYVANDLRVGLFKREGDDKDAA